MGCSYHNPAANTVANGGDPGNRTLHALADDPIFHQLPAGFSAVGPLQQRPAYYQAPGFDGGGWHSPMVQQCLASNLTWTAASAAFDQVKSLDVV